MQSTASRGQGGNNGAMMLAPYAPGDWVRHPLQPDWGPGQVQSAIGSRVTVNFLHAGKRLINIDQVPLTPADPPGDNE